MCRSRSGQAGQRSWAVVRHRDRITPRDAESACRARAGRLLLFASGSANQVPFQKRVVREKNRCRECQPSRREHAGRNDAAQCGYPDRHGQRSAEGAEQDGKPSISIFSAESIGIDAIPQKLHKRPLRTTKAHEGSGRLNPLQNTGVRAYKMPAHGRTKNCRSVFRTGRSRLARERLLRRSTTQIAAHGPRRPGLRLRPQPN